MDRHHDRIHAVVRVSPHVLVRFVILDQLTFSDLGIPFPLFTAPVDEAEEYWGESTCAKCGAVAKHCFSVHGGTPRNGLMACYGCLRAGHASIHKESVVGFISGAGAEEGLTDAVGESSEELLRFGFELIPHQLEPDEPDWHHVCVPVKHLCELVRTPNFETCRDSYDRCRS